MALTAFALNCTLKNSRGNEASSTDVLLNELMATLSSHDVSGEIVRAVDHDIKPGVTDDEGEGDAWPALLKRILTADIFVLGTPIWIGQPSSVAKRVIERLDALIHDMDDRHRMRSYNRVAIVAVVGNEDGAHHVSAECYQALSDCGFTIPASATTYWVGEAMGSVDYKDQAPPPKKTALTTRMAAANAAHLAGLLKSGNYPGTK